MTSRVPYSLILALCCLVFSGVSQDLKQATIDYFTASHYPYDPEVIRSSKIKSIEKYKWSYQEEKPVYGTLQEKHEFNTWGKPEYSYLKPLYSDHKEVIYCYDSSGNLTRKEHFAHAPELRYQNHDTYEWRYDDAGFLTRQRRYMIIDKLRTEHGTSGFPETTTLYTNDSISYNHEENSVSIASNDPAHCQDLPPTPRWLRLFPPNFKSPIATTLRFHPNHQLRSKISTKDSTVRTESFDPCGNALQEQKTPKLIWLEEVLSDTIDCLDAEKNNILHRITDTTRLNGQLVFYFRSNFSHTQHRAMAPIFTHTEQVVFYDLEFRKVYSEVSTASSSEYPPMDTKRFDKIYFVYLENGLLHQIVTKDKENRLVEITEFRISYFE